MGSAERIRDLLPSLWRPEPGSMDFFSTLIAVSGRGLDKARVEAGDAMQAHWVRFADSALLSPYVSAFRRESGAVPLLPGAPEVAEHPYIDDLTRLAGVHGLAPFTDPLDGRERVEDFRTRLLETVRLWQEGLGTRAALTGAARIALSGMPERAVQVEEFAPGSRRTQGIATAGAPDGMVGPLMRWRVESQAVLPTIPEVYIEGVTPVAGEIDATENPIIELFNPETGTGRGILYEGTLAPGQVLAILPAHSSWLGGPGGPLSAISEPSGEAEADPTAPGPWAPDAGGPALTVSAFAQAPDGALWAALVEDAGGALARRDPAGWKVVFSGLPAVGCLLADGADLLVGHTNGLSRLAVFDPAPALLPDPATGTGPSVAALVRDPVGSIWAATSRGAARVGTDDTLTMVGPGARAETETPLAAAQADPDGILHFGGESGIFRHDPGHDRWHVFHGGDSDDTVPDWVPWNPAADPLPNDAEVFLPPVTAIIRGQDATLWIGTAAGLARYRARAVRGTYATRLNAHPEFGTGAVHALAIDERQRLWVGTARGLLVHDGRDCFQAQSGALVRLPRQPEPPPDVDWRFDRVTGAWQSVRAGGAAGFQTQAPAVLTTAEPKVTAILWTDGAVVRLGVMTDGDFVPDAAAVPGPLRARLKPEPDRTVDGGLPALPRLPAGTSDWRFLALEEAAPPVPKSFPAWTREGRLLPPPDSSAAPGEGRYLAPAALADLDTVFAYNPAARVTFRWRPRAALSVTVRMRREAPDETLPAPVLDRVFAAMDMVRPAGARIRLALGETVVRGEEDG